MLDLGCGVGYATTWFALIGDTDREVVGVDVSARSIEVARMLAQRIAVPNVQFVEMDIDNELPEGPFDAIIDMVALPYTEQLEVAASHVRKALADEGVFISVPQLGTAPEIRAFIVAVESSGLRLQGFSWVYARDLGRNVARPITTWRLADSGIAVDR